MKSVIKNILTNEETKIDEGCYVMYGDKDNEIRIIIRKHGDEEFVKINGNRQVILMPRVANSVYVKLETL